MSIVQSMLNVLLIFIIVRVANYEAYMTKTEYNINLAIRLSIVQFFNTSVTNFIVRIFFLGSKRPAYGNVFGVNGLAENQNYLFLSSIFTPIIIELLDINYYAKKT